MNKTRKKIEQIAYSSLIAALYVALSWLSNILGLASYAVQVRFSEALCILPFFTPHAVPGLFIGCLISNLTMGAHPIDIAFGSLATLVGAYIAGKIKNKYLVAIPTVVANAIVVPLVVLFCYTSGVKSLGAYIAILVSVTIGEVVSAYVLGTLLLIAIDKRKIFKK